MLLLGLGPGLGLGFGSGSADPNSNPTHNPTPNPNQVVAHGLAFNGKTSFLRDPWNVRG